MTEQKPQGSEVAQPQLEIQKIFLKDVSFESPNSPSVFTREWKPDVNVNLSSNATKVNDTLYEVVLDITVTAKHDEETAFLIEVKQAGIFRLSGLNEQQMGHALGSYCPNVLFPYAREAISELISKGGFPQLILAPVNFDALYAQHQERTKQQQVDQSDATH